MADITKNPLFTDEAAARAHLERIRWPQGVICVHCGAFGDAISVVQKTDKRRKPKTEGKRHKAGTPRPLLLQGLRGHLHCDGRHRHGGQPHPAEQVAAMPST